MSDTRDDLPALSDDVKASWHRFLDSFEPLRPELYRYCRQLTHSAWDAEDLLQDTLMRGFVTLGTLFRELPNPRAWLFRVASNLWIDRMRREKRELLVEQPPEAFSESDPGLALAARDAAGILFVQLSPQERAAVLLKDVFEFSLEEVAEVLSTSVGAIKAALHRGRGRLIGPFEGVATPNPPAVLAAFCEAFNARDLGRMTALLVEGSTVEIVGVVTEYGPDAPKDPRTGSFAGTLQPISMDDRGGVPAEHLEGYIATSPRCEARAFRGEWIVLFWFEHEQGPMVRTLMRVEAEGVGIRRVQNYFFSPELIAEVCEDMQVPYRVNGYSYWRKEE